MSDLQISMILLGILLILVVVMFNWWQDRRIRRKMQDHFPEREHDPLMGTAAAEVARREPGFGLHVMPDPGLAEEQVDTDDPDEADPATEAVIDIRFPQPVEAIQLYPALEALQRIGTKPVRLFAESESGRHRSVLRTGEAYTALHLAILLANRSGAITDIEWSRFWTLAQELASKFDASVEGPEQSQVLFRAVELDTQCAALDAQVGLALQLREPVPVADVSRVLKDVGFLSYQHQLSWMSDAGQPRFSALFDGQPALAFQAETVARIDLLIDLPNSPPDDQAFSRMATVGRDLARRLGGRLLDDQGNPVAEQTDQTIDKQLHALYLQLEQAGFMAGEPRTCRVFS